MPKTISVAWHIPDLDSPLDDHHLCCSFLCSALYTCLLQLCLLFLITGSSDDWSFDFRNSKALYHDSDDDSEDGHGPTSDHQLKELDLSSRQESVEFKSNPFRIAKINAAARASRASPPKASEPMLRRQASTSNPSTAKPAPGTIMEGFRKQQERIQNKRVAKTVVPKAHIVATSSPPRSTVQSMEPSTRLQRYHRLVSPDKLFEHIPSHAHTPRPCPRFWAPKPQAQLGPETAFHSSPIRARAPAYPPQLLKPSMNSSPIRSVSTLSTRPGQLTQREYSTVPKTRKTAPPIQASSESRSKPASQRILSIQSPVPGPPPAVPVRPSLSQYKLSVPKQTTRVHTSSNELSHTELSSISRKRKLRASSPDEDDPDEAWSTLDAGKRLGMKARSAG